MNKTIKLIIIAILGLILAWRLFPQAKSALRLGIPSVTPSPQLISGWTIVSENENQIKIEKTTVDSKSKIKPTVVLTQKTVDQIESVKDYTDRFKSGALLTVPNLKYLTDQTEDKDGIFVRRLTGHYTNAGLKVYFSQRLAVKGTTVQTITASYLGEAEIEEEISKVFDYLLLVRPL